MANKTGFILTENDALVLRQVITEFRSRFKNQNNRPRIQEELGQTPEVYIARIPSEGIAALRDTPGTSTSSLIADTVSFTDCAIYRILDDVLSPISVYPQRVYNISTTAITGNSWAVIARDKFGTWVCVTEPPASASAPVTGGTTTSTNYTMGSTGTWEGGGSWSVTLPSAGTYLIYAQVTLYTRASAITGSAYNNIEARIYDTTISAEVPTCNGTVVSMQAANVDVHGTLSMFSTIPYVVDSARILTLQFSRVASVVWAGTVILAADNSLGAGYCTSIGYMKIG